MDKSKNIFTKQNIIFGLKWFFFSYIWLALLTFIIDIITKQIVKNMMYVGQQIFLIPNFLSLHYVQNVGMAWGINFGNELANIVIFTLISIVGAALLIFVSVKFWKKINGVGKAALMLMISGTIGNLIDRAFYVDPKGFHFVVDFIAFDFGSYSFPRFNVADSCLVIGTFMLVIYLFVKDFKEEMKKKSIEKVEVIDDKDKTDNG